jgi:hypothetical protein
MATSAAFVAVTYWFGRTPNPAAIVSDGVVDDGLDRLAGSLPGPLARRVPGRGRQGQGRGPGNESDPPGGAADTPGAGPDTDPGPRSGRARRPRRGSEPGRDRTTPMPRPVDPQDDTQVFPDAPPARPPTVRPANGDDPTTPQPIHERPSRRRPRRPRG